MPEPAETAAIIGGGLLASEAMGVTNVTPIGAGGQNKGPNIPPTLPQGTGIPPGLLAMLSRDSGIPPGLMGEISNLRGQVGNLRGQLSGFASGQGNAFNMWGDFPTEWADPPWGNPPGGNNGPGGGGPQGAGGGNIWTNMTDPQAGLQAGDVIAGGAATVGGTRDLVGGTIGGLTTTGNTLSQATRALAGKEYGTGGTFAEPFIGSGRRKINWGDYTPDFNGKGNEGFREDMFIPGLAAYNEVKNSDKSLIGETATTMAASVSPVGVAAGSSGGGSPDPDEPSGDPSAGYSTYKPKGAPGNVGIPGANVNPKSSRSNRQETSDLQKAGKTNNTRKKKRRQAVASGGFVR